MPITDDPIFRGGEILARLAQSRREATRDPEYVPVDEEDNPRPAPLTDCERWLLRLTGAGAVRFTETQRIRLRRPYAWTMGDGQGHLLNINAPCPNELFAEDTRRGEDFRRYVESGCARARSAAGRVSKQTVLSIVSAWRYEENAKRKPGSTQGATAENDDPGYWGTVNT